MSPMIYCPLCGGDTNFCRCPDAAVKEDRVIPAKDVFCKVSQDMFTMLVAGREVIIGQADGSQWHFALDDIGWAKMADIIRVARLEQTGYQDC